MTEAYDSEKCITAGELRGMGLLIPEEVPDCGWIHRGAYKIEAGDVQLKDDGYGFGMDLKVTITEPFRWVSVEAAFEK